MILVDIILALAALTVLGGFLWVVVSFVPEPSLMVVVAVGVGMAAFDFLREIVRSIRGKSGGNGGA